MKKSVKTAMAGIISALSVVLLFLGGTIWILAYIMPMLTGMLSIILIKSLNKKTALIVYICVSILSIILLPDKECALTYIFFFGYYPIIKESISKIKNKFISIMLRFLIFNAAIISSQLICVYVFLIPFDDFLGKWGIIILIFAANIVFALYEKLLDVVFLLYERKYSKRVNKFLYK